MQSNSRPAADHDIVPLLNQFWAVRRVAFKSLLKFFHFLMMFYFHLLLLERDLHFVFVLSDGRNGESWQRRSGMFLIINAIFSYDSLRNFHAN